MRRKTERKLRYGPHHTRVASNGLEEEEEEEEEEVVVVVVAAA
jgi:hypothetical protein